MTKVEDNVTAVMQRQLADGIIQGAVVRTNAAPDTVCLCGDQTQGVPMTRKSRFDIASAGKTFTAAYYDLMFSCNWQDDAGNRRSFGWDMSPVGRPAGLSEQTIFHSGWTEQTFFVDSRTKTDLPYRGLDGSQRRTAEDHRIHPCK